MTGSVVMRSWTSVGLLVVVSAGFACSSSDPARDTGGVTVAGAPGGILPNGTGGAGGSMIGVPPTGTAGTSGQVVPPAGGSMPCEVETVVKSSCQTCHGNLPIGGAPMKLLTLADFQRDYPIVSTTQLAGRTMKMYELARIRVNREMGTTIMPQGAPLSDTAKTMLTTWLSSGAPAGTACNNTGASGMGAVGMAGSGSGMAGTGGGTNDKPGTYNRCETIADSFEALVELEGETCYEFPTHGVSSPTDTTKFNVPPGETYNQFYFEVPWEPNTVATRFGADFDNLQVLHHWLGFTSTSNNPHGTVSRDVTGTTLGENSELVGGWAVGGCNTTMPPGVGLKLPDAGTIMIQWHHNNNTGQSQPDGSAVQWCTKPASGVEHVAGITFLGTEDFYGFGGMPPGRHNFTTSCSNNSSAPITIVGFTPHMHLLGVHMMSAVEKMGSGTRDTVFDQAFQFDQQVNYLVNPSVVLQPGDKVWTTCTFDNTTGANVAFGQPTTSEMCYQFAVAYPYDALNSGNISLIGATNTCWGATTPMAE